MTTETEKTMIVELKKWKCGSRAQGSIGGELSDCNWPICGCDPYANKVIETLDECGLLNNNYDGGDR